MSEGNERGVEYTTDRVTLFSISIGGRLGGYIEGVDGANNRTGESICEFTVMANPVKPLEVRSIAK